MYSIKRKKKVPKKFKFANMCEFEKLDNFLMPSRSNSFSISGTTIKNIRIFEATLARPMTHKLVNNKYKKLIARVTELLTDGDDDGNSFRIALNEIEKFRQEIKNKYRVFLEQKELNFMAKQLSVLQKEAKRQFAELQADLTMNQTNGKNR